MLFLNRIVSISIVIYLFYCQYINLVRHECIHEWQEVDSCNSCSWLLVKPNPEKVSVPNPPQERQHISGKHQSTSVGYNGYTSIAAELRYNLVISVVLLVDSHFAPSPTPGCVLSFDETVGTQRKPKRPGHSDATRCPVLPRVGYAPVVSENLGFGAAPPLETLMI